MLIQQIKQTQLDGKLFKAKTNVNYSQIGAQVDNLTIPKGVYATLTTRTDNTSGVLTAVVAGSLSGYISSGDKICIGWVDANGVLQKRMNVTTSITGDAITFSLGNGTNMPVATTKVVVAKQMSYPVDANTTAIYAQVLDGTSRMCMMLAKASDIATPTYANAMSFAINGLENAVVLNNSSEIAAVNSSFATADTVYLGNLSDPLKDIVANVLPIIG